MTRNAVKQTIDGLGVVERDKEAAHKRYELKLQKKFPPSLQIRRRSENLCEKKASRIKSIVEEEKNEAADLNFDKDFKINFNNEPPK